MNDYDGQDRREHRRYPVTLKICYSALDTFFYDYAINISQGGVFIRTDKPLPVGSPVHLKFSIPGTEREIESEGQVMRVIKSGHNPEPPGMGIRFESIKKEDVRLIAKLWKESTQP